jgi:hypothetical protein
MRISKTYGQFQDYLDIAAPIPSDLPLLKAIEEAEEAEQ